VEGVRDAQAGGAQAGGAQAALGLGHARLGPGDHRLARVVEVGQDHPVQAREDLAGGGRVRGHRGHGARLAGRGGDELAPLGHEPDAGRVVGDHAAGGGRRELAQRVPEQQVGGHAQGAGEAGQGQPQRRHDGLADLGGGEGSRRLGRLLGRIEIGEQRPGQPVDGAGQALQLGAEGGEATVEIGAHPRGLQALAREEEGDPALLGGTRGGGGGDPGGERGVIAESGGGGAQLGGQVGEIGGDDRQAGDVRAAQGHGVGHVAEGEVGFEIGEPSGQLLGGAAEQRGGRGGEEDELGGRFGRRLRRRLR
jgi:hypothetical protein